MEETKDVISRLYTLRAGLSAMAILTDRIFDAQLQALGELNKTTSAFNLPDASYRYLSIKGIWTERFRYSWDNYGSVVFDYPKYNKYNQFSGAPKWYMQTSRFGYEIAYDAVQNCTQNRNGGVDECKYKQGYYLYGEISEKIKFFPAFKKYVMVTKGVSEDEALGEMHRIASLYGIIPTDEAEALLTWLCTDEGEKHCQAHLQRLMSYKKGLFRRPRFKTDIENLQRLINGLPEYRVRAGKVLAQRDAAVNSLRTEYKVLLDALRQEYNALLDERDWKYIDYVIFALETRRADNMKEALRYVDDEVRTNRIVNAMQQAAAQICQTIIEQTDRIIGAIEKCAAQLCATVAAVGTQISAQLSHLTSAVELNNALVQKSNASSEQLLDVIHTARMYS